MVIDELSAASLDAALMDDLRRLLPHLTSRSLDLAQETPAALGDPATTLLVAREQPAGRVVGMVSLIGYHVLTGRRARIEDLVVDPEFRGRGIGEQLMQAALARARQDRAQVVDLTSNPRRSAANRLYLRLGFTRWETNVYRLVLEEA